MTDSAKKLDDLAGLGATPEQLAQAKASLDQLDALNTAKKKSEEMHQSAKSIIESVMTPTRQHVFRVVSAILIVSRDIDAMPSGCAHREAGGSQIARIVGVAGCRTLVKVEERTRHVIATEGGNGEGQTAIKVDVGPCAELVVLAPADAEAAVTVAHQALIRPWDDVRIIPYIDAVPVVR